ncbi:hypothetical protein ABPG77_000484 [Micractinium sp. CCAP 211/92]
MEGATIKPKSRRRPARKAEAAATGADGTSAAGAATGARPAATATTGATAGAADEAPQAKPSLSQRVAQSLRQLSQLGTTSKTEEGGEEDNQRGPGEEPAQPHITAVAQKDAEQDEAMAWEHVLGRSVEPIAEEESDGLAVGAAALGRRLSALTPAAPGGRLAVGWPVGAAVALLTLALLCGPLAPWQPRAGSGEAVAKLSRQLADVQGLLEAVDARQAALANSLQTLQASYTAQAGLSAELRAEVAAAKADLAALQAATAAAAAQAAAAAEAAAAGATRPDDGAASTVPRVTFDEERLRQLAREEAAAELDLYAADRTGQPDWALASVGGAVVAHSQPRGAKLRTGRVYPHANNVLGPVSQPGGCLPLLGSTGWVDVRLSRGIHPSAFTYEHIPPRIAYDIRTAPRNLTLLGFLGRPPAVRGTNPPAGSAGAIPLGSFAFDAHARRAMQTFPLAMAATPGNGSQPAQPPQDAPLIDHIRLLVLSNHGHPEYTCLYRLRMHGTLPLAGA